MENHRIVWYCNRIFSSPIGGTDIELEGYMWNTNAGIALNEHFVELITWYLIQWGFSDKMLGLARHIDSVREA